MTFFKIYTTFLRNYSIVINHILSINYKKSTLNSSFYTLTNILFMQITENI